MLTLQGASQTITTLKNLVQKGVKVDLGMPYELWDEPSVEVSDMKRQVGASVSARFRRTFDKTLNFQPSAPH